MNRTIGGISLLVLSLLISMLIISCQANVKKYVCIDQANKISHKIVLGPEECIQSSDLVLVTATDMKVIEDEFSRREKAAKSAGTWPRMEESGVVCKWIGGIHCYIRYCCRANSSECWIEEVFCPRRK